MIKKRGFWKNKKKKTVSVSDDLFDFKGVRLMKVVNNMVTEVERIVWNDGKCKTYTVRGSVLDCVRWNRQEKEIKFVFHEYAIEIELIVVCKGLNYQVLYDKISSNEDFVCSSGNIYPGVVFYKQLRKILKLKEEKGEDRINALKKEIINSNGEIINALSFLKDISEVTFTLTEEIKPKTEKFTL